MPSNASHLGQEIFCGLRPEHIEIAQSPITLHVATVENTGIDTYITGHLEGREYTVLSRSRLTIRPGDVVPLKIDMSRAHLFDRATELRMTITPGTALRN
jgi:multiple sugar transport system ATP-binding protein